MSTILQRDLAKAIIENRSLPKHKRKNKKELMVSVGYGVVTANSIPGKVLEQKGVQKALKDIMNEAGLTEELITSALVYDIENKPKKRVKELGLGAEILGMKKQQDGNTTNILNIFSDEQLKRAAREYLASKEDLSDVSK